MTTISDTTKIVFFEFLNDEISVSDLEKFVYKQKDLEEQLGNKIYFELVSFNYQNRVSAGGLKDFILGNIIDEGEYQTSKLKVLLSDFISDIKNTQNYLTSFYNLYCGVYNDDEPRKFEFKFLGHLGLNYLVWFDERYLKTQYGDNWQNEYQMPFEEIEFYHRQLRPFAELILDALDSGKIHINRNGNYEISDNLKKKLETQEFYELKRPGKQDR